MDIQKLRNQTPGTSEVIHFNNAGASLMPSPVSESVISYLREETLRGGYETARKHQEDINRVYSTIANFINAADHEIALQENATMAWNMAFFAINFEDGDRILTSVSEYASNYIAYLKLQEEVNVSIEVIPNDETGSTSVEALSSMMDEKVKLISITHMPTNSGLVNPVEEIGTLAKEHPCLYLVDACQSVGQYPVDVEKIGCDMLSATGRKYLRGPRGTGFLYVNDDILPHLTPPFLDLHSAKWVTEDEYQMRDDARRFENWETNYAGVIGLKKAVSYAAQLGIDEIWHRIRDLGEKLRSTLSQIPNVTVHDIGKTKGGIVTFTIDGVSAESVLKELSEKHNINVSTSGKHSTLLDMEKRSLDELTRASVHYYNTDEEILKLTRAIRKISEEVNS
ncbi:aminotransferase class V-fold PLP-dependent enzyme [Fodinibius halophilus]|uniref:Aminotransferase class V-fold PLP-dependent enzyme n=1 Tax=Fodinibius halophilus TaxID=1736908 RepID=A0A6M1T7U5_9BACT|nr:aminotransferase class V-fold PLP-dependent enzyme [Fodinibius halophilus]NGP88051.1 aminotransferase class V-fold PLP-dependent enzyme [Fodinibius halophilus]